MTSRDARLRNELIGIVILKICVLAVLWAVFVHGARVPVDAGTVARHTAASPSAKAFPTKGEPNGH